MLLKLIMVFIGGWILHKSPTFIPYIPLIRKTGPGSDSFGKICLMFVK
jgi:hypothetical protein